MLARGMNSRERRGTSGVHRDARAAQIQTIRNPVRGNTVRTTRRSVRTDREMIKRRALNALVIVMRNADEHAEIGSMF